MRDLDAGWSSSRFGVISVRLVRHDGQEAGRSVALELDGPGVSPETVDAPLLFELAAAFFLLLQGNAEDAATPITLRGVHIIDKCLRLAVPVEHLEQARQFAEDAMRQMVGEQDPPRGLGLVADRGRSALGKLQPDQTAKIVVGKWERPLALPKQDDVILPNDSILSVRAVPVRVGGAKPLIRFKSMLEDEPFTLTATEEQARKLGALLYKEVDIDALISRAADGTIDGGKLVSFEPVIDGDPRPAWREWFKSVGGEEWRPDAEEEDDDTDGIRR